MQNATVIYHAECADGFGAAYAAWLKLGDAADYVPATYGQPPPELPPRRDLYILDFSYPLQTIRDLQVNHTLTLLDHHKTALHLSDIPGCSIDVSASGAVLAWRHFHPGEPVPKLLEYVQDRDLWKWHLADSRAISAYIHSHGYDFNRWLSMETDVQTDQPRLVEIGEAILRVQAFQLDKLTLNAKAVDIGGHSVPSVYAPVLVSEIGERLLELHPGAPFAAIYYDRDDGRKWSLRSRSDFDVSVVAQTFGGGGHAQAAGFTEPLRLVPHRIFRPQPPAGGN